MKNKKIILGALGTMLSVATFCQDRLSVKTDLKNVTVFTNSAELNHQASVNLPMGSSEIIFTHVASNIDENTIQIGSDPSVTILSVRTSKNTSIQTAATDEYRNAENTYKVEKNKLVELLNLKDTEESVLKLLENNQKVSSENSGTSVNELIKMTEYYQPKYLQVKNNISKVELQIESQSKVVDHAKAQLDDLQGQSTAAGGQLVVQVMNSSTGVKPFDMNYLTPQAGWKATYDVRAKDLQAPVQIIYKGNVSQNTGLDWKNVHLRLSSGNPTGAGMVPTLLPWHLQFNEPFSNYGMRAESAQLLDEVVVTSNLRAKSSPFKMSAPMVVQTENQMHTTFDIETPYSIMSNGKIHAVNLQDYNAPTSYKYVAAPRLDQDVYLTAELTDYENLNLIPGQANVFVENTIVGKTYLNPNNTSDTLFLSMGKDKLINVNRELVSELSQTSTFGNNKTERYTYEIQLKNNKKTAISLKLNDQYPLSTDKAMEIELLENGAAVVDTETGILSWNLELAPGETKKVKFSYSIKYPKGKNIAH